MNRTIGFLLLLTGAAGSMVAGTAPTPEIDASTATGAVALVSGAILVLRTRRKQ